MPGPSPIGLLGIVPRLGLNECLVPFGDRLVSGSGEVDPDLPVGECRGQPWLSIVSSDEDGRRRVMEGEACLQ